MNILKNLSLKNKLALIIFFPLCAILWNSIHLINSDLKIKGKLQQEEEVTTISIDLGNVIQALQNERGISYIYLSSNESGFLSKLNKAQISTDETLKISEEKIIPLLNNIDSNNLKNAYQVAMTKLAPIKKYRELINEKKITAEETLDFYSSMINNYLSLISYLRLENSSIEIANELEAYILLNHYSDVRGLERAYIGRLLLTTENQNELIFKIKVANELGIDQLQNFKDFASKNTMELFNQGLDQKLEGQINNIKNDVIKNIDTQSVTSEEWFELSSASMDSLDAIKDQVARNVSDRVRQLSNQATNSLYFAIFISSFIILVTIFLTYTIVKSILVPIRRLGKATQEVLKGDLKVKVKNNSNDEIGELSKSFNEMISGLETKTEEIEEQSWIKGNVAQISTLAQSCENLEELAQKVITHLAGAVDAGSGGFYICEQNPDSAEEDLADTFILAGTYAYTERNHNRNRVKYGETLVGQCATEKQMIILNDVPSEYIEIESGLGVKNPLNVTVVPIVIENKVLGVFELANFHRVTEKIKTLYSETAKVLGLIINNILDKKRTKDLLSEAQALSEETRIQSDELRAANEQLEEKTSSLERQKNEVEKKNSEIEIAREKLQLKTKDLEAASQYKSDFLANMSHELRTPLNSLLLLSQMLTSNDEGNLTEDQLESLRIIHNSGQDLLQLINDILDLSKVEAGKLSIDHEEVPIKEILSHIKEQFDPLSKQKELAFNIEIEQSVPNTIKTDEKRVEQILRNLLSNSFKFTHEGSITLRIYQPTKETQFSSSTLSEQGAIAYEVKDTGIGVPKERLEEIFGAFQQLDSSITRKYGGTGLGLTISRKLAQLLGGEIQCQSEEGKGSAFTLFLPLEKITHTDGALPNMDVISQDKLETILDQAIEGSNQEKNKNVSKSLLIIEDDITFANIIKNIADVRGYTTAIASNGEEGLLLAEKHLPDGIILDLGLADIDGLAVLDKLKDNQHTKNIPVHIISGRDPENIPFDQTIGFLSKPITDQTLNRVFGRFENEWNSGGLKKILIIENDKNCSKLITKALEKYNIKPTQIESCIEAKELLKSNKYDCIILDLGLPDIDGVTFLSEIKATTIDTPPIIVYTGRELTKEDYQQLRLFADSVILKDGKSLDHLQNEISMFLQEVDEKADDNELNQGSFQDLNKRKILIVDDDIRNTISLIKIFKSKGMEVITADNGLDGIKKLENDPSIELVLMDIMMPIMNGFEAIAKIRKMEKFRNLPIIALTAKAMPEDGKQCIEAGANEYITKPVNMEKLLSVINVWLPKKEEEMTTS